MRKHLSILSIVASIFVVFVFTLVITSCSKDSGGTSSSFSTDSVSKSKKISNPEVNFTPLSLNLVGDASFRLNALGGTLEVTDPQNPIYGAGLIIPANSYRDTNSLYITKQWFGGSVEYASFSRLDKLPEGIKYPDNVKDKILYIAKSKTLVFSGIMTNRMRNTLLTKVSPTSKAFQAAVKDLYNKSKNGGEPRIIAASSPDPSFNLSRDVGNAVLILQVNDGKKDSFLSFLIETTSGDKIITNANLSSFLEPNFVDKDTNIQFEDKDVKVGKTYTYNIKAKNGDKEIDSTNTESITLTNCDFTLKATPACGKIPDKVVIKLSWKAYSVEKANKEKVINYNIYRDGKLYRDALEKTDFTDTNVKDGTTYTYLVKAKIPSASSNATTGAVASSNEATATAAMTEIVKPASFTLNKPTSECNKKELKINIEWKASTGATYYNIYRDDKLYKNKVNETKFTDTKVKFDTTYKYLIKAINCVGETDSTAISITVSKPEMPVDDTNTPENESIFTLKTTTKCNGTNPEVELEWNKANNADSYDVYRKGENDSKYELIKENAKNPQLTDIAVQAGKTYNYYVKAINCVGNIQTNSASVIASETCSDVPGAFTIKNPTSECNGANPEIKIEWNDSERAASYDIYRDNKLYKSDVKGTTFINANVEGGKTYTYSVKAKNSAGSTDSSNTVTAVSKNTCSLTTPGTFTLSPVDSNCSGSTTTPQITLKWSIASGATAYDVYRNGKLYKSNISKTTKTIKLVQILEPPKFTIQAVPFLNIIKPPSGIAVGFPISFDILDDLHSGNTMVGKLPLKQFKEPVTIKIPYSKDLVKNLNIKPSSLKLYEFHLNNWKAPLTIDRIDKDNGIIYAKVKEFSIFQVFAPSKTSNSLPLIVDTKKSVKNTDGTSIAKDVSGVEVEEENGTINITYNLQDAEGDTCIVTIEYRQANASPDLDTGWNKIKTIKNVSTKVKPGENNFNSFQWNSKSTLSNTSGYFQIRVTPYQKIETKLLMGGAGYSKIFRIKNSQSKINAPTKLEGQVIGNDNSTPPQVLLSWDASSPSTNVSGYNIYRQARFDTSFEKTFRKVGESSSTSFVDDTLTSSFYEAIYKLTAFDSSSGNESTFCRDIRLSSLVLGAYYY